MKASSFLLSRVFWLELLFLFMKKTNKNSTLVKLQSIHLNHFKLEGPTYDRMAFIFITTYAISAYHH